MILEREEGEDRDRGRETDRQTDISMRENPRSDAASIGYRSHKQGMLPDWELNMKPFGVQDDSPTNGATQPGQP